MLTGSLNAAITMLRDTATALRNAISPGARSPFAQARSVRKPACSIRRRARCRPLVVRRMPRSGGDYV
ncbi:MAG TPA: hypothetical protein PL002_05515, partial [Flavobacteriales bacterium]|nr:hypothetical protein [Flavobacteriales bacterium]